MDKRKIISRPISNNKINLPHKGKFSAVRGLSFVKTGKDDYHLNVEMDSEIVELKSIIDSAISTLSEIIQGESRLTIEMNTTISTDRIGETGAKLYLFNIGGKIDSGREGIIKITVETPIFPLKSK